MSSQNLIFSRILIPAFLLFFLVSMQPVDAAGFYKWVDENGVTQYTQLPPPVSHKATKIEPFTGGSGNEEQLKQLNEKLARDIELRKQQDAEKGLSEEELKMLRQMRLNCQVARTNLAALEDSTNVKFQDASGAVTTFTPEERASKAEGFKRYIDENCQTL
jgi:hypothetical protein